MQDRRGERVGWILGWLGGFVWVAILSVVFFVQGKPAQASLGLLITGIACASIVWLSPWRHPRVRYRALMVPIYLLFFVAVAWGAWSMGDLRQMGINSWWAVLILLPILTPFWTVGSRCWDDALNPPDMRAE